MIHCQWTVEKYIFMSIYGFLNDNWAPLGAREKSVKKKNIIHLLDMFFFFFFFFSRIPETLNT